MKNLIEIEAYKSIIPILKAEIAVLESLSRSHEEVRQAVCGRKWTDFEKLIGELNKLSAEFEALEIKRAEAFSQLARQTDDEDMNFYNVIIKMPYLLRDEFSSLYRQLKVFVLRIRLANESLMNYIVEAKATVTDFLGAAFPDRKGRLYTRQGTEMEADMRSMVLDRSL